MINKSLHGFHVQMKWKLFAFCLLWESDNSDDGVEMCLIKSKPIFAEVYHGVKKPCKRSAD